MNKRQYALILGFCWFLIFFVTGCGEPEPYSREIFAMDTYITCQVISGDKAQAETGLDSIEEAFSEIDRLTNRFDENSEVYAINKNAGIAPVKVNEDVFSMVKTALEWSERTGGAFNILIGSTMDLWGFGSEHPRVPAADELTEALTKANYQQIELNSQNSTIFLPTKGMVMDLGGVAKGYATDKAVEALRRSGIKNALINAGGNVYALGTKAEGKAWRVGVQDPQDPQGIAALLEVSDVALVSSGDYQRYFEIGNIRYHHILDPATGCPAGASAGTTVIMKSATLADILSTAFFVKGPAEGIELAESFSQVDAVMIVNREGGTFSTKGWDNYLVRQ